MRSSSISIVIPTFNRHGPLRRALASAISQAVPTGVTVAIVVVDNSEDGNAAPVVREFGMSPIPIHYVSEPRPGVANARNAGVTAATGAWIAFLDDDEEAAPTWIAAHWRTIKATGADAVFGPVTAMAEADGASNGLEFMFAREIALADGADIGPRSARLGTNNSVFSKATCLTDDVPFDPSLNNCGGEDSLLIKRAGHRGKAPELVGRCGGDRVGATAPAQLGLHHPTPLPERPDPVLRAHHGEATALARTGALDVQSAPVSPYATLPCS